MQVLSTEAKKIPLSTYFCHIPYRVDKAALAVINLQVIPDPNPIRNLSRWVGYCPSDIGSHFHAFINWFNKDVSYLTLDALSQSLDECRTVLRRLFPDQEMQQLLPLSRNELVALIDRSPRSALSITSPSASNTSPTSQEYRSPLNSGSDECRSLANLEQIPNQDIEWDEERRNRDPIPTEADDVNALSLSVDRQSSYLGATSIKAALLVMLKVAPRLRSLFLAPSNNRQISASSNYPTPRPGSSAKDLQAISWSSNGQTLIDAYFNRVQIFVPMLDEPTFRADFLSGRRQDAPWLGLLNMVFAMGSIVASKSDDHNHINYYNQAKDHLGIDSFGSGHLETLQALSLMGGLYLHYINRPNTANAICGAALRMACAMGLHRESMHENSTESNLIAEQRRRTWWSLFCLDTWASTTLGRPSMGRWAMLSPCSLLNQHLTPFNQNMNITPLVENIKFCKVATQIQDALAQTPLLRNEDLTNLDRQLVEWYDNLPWILRSTEPCPESIHTARCVMKWRYQNLRMVLYRSVLLNLANRGNQGISPTKEELAAVQTCRKIAQESIENISREWTPNQMLGWNGVWFMYQASMIPLVSMFWESWNTNLVRIWQSQIEVVLEAFDGMADWSLAAKRSREVVSKVYEVNGRNYMDSDMLQQVEIMGEEQLMMLDNGGIWDLDGMLWGNLPDGLDMPYDGLPMQYDDSGMAQFEGPYIFHQ
ncbi:fungal specific transcription factor domain-containing protein [Botrytis cinerea]